MHFSFTHRVRCLCVEGTAESSPKYLPYFATVPLHLLSILTLGQCIETLLKLQA